MKRRFAPVIFAPLVLLVLISYSFLLPPSTYGQGNLQATPTLPFSPWCCAFVVKTTVPFVWVRPTASSSADIVATVGHDQVLTADLRFPATSFDGVQWWGHIIGLTFSGWVEINSLTLAPHTNNPRLGTAAAWSGGARVRVRAKVPYVWLRSFPSSFAFSSLYEVKTGGEFIVIGDPVADFRQWWWPVGYSLDERRVGWVEQNSLELLVVGAASPTPIIVPTTIIVPTPGPTAVNSQTIPATFQAFENGFMIWRADSGVIFVLINDGRFLSYWPDYYGRLPDNPVTLPAPAGRIRPMMGFGKVWGNIQDVEFHLGWATTPERSYIATSYPIAPNSIAFSLLDGRQAILKPNSQWTLADGSLPPIGAISLPGPRQTQVPTTVVIPTPTVASATISAAYEPFESGFMIWRGDNDMIYVMLNTGEVKPLYSARGLADNPVTDTPPAGRTKPVSGFGRVWGSYTDVRAALGWALDAEQGYTATISTTAPNAQFPPDLYFTISLPDGRRIGVTKQNWKFV